MKTYLTRLPILFLLGLTLPWAIGQPRGRIPAKSALNAGCCGTQSVDVTFGEKQLYIPHVFTPNGDGFNDYFMPHATVETTIVRDFSILSATGDSILFTRPCIDYSTQNSRSAYAWNGRRKDGTCYRGLFKYRLWIDDEQASKGIIAGEACAIICGPKAKVFKSKDGCFFSD